jgi:hypothetical protein
MINNIKKRAVPYKLLLLALVAFAGAFVTNSGVVHAAAQDLTMTPTSLTQQIQPGTTYKGTFQVLNRGVSGYDFKVYATPYSVKGEEYTPDFTTLSSAPNAPSWFTFSVTKTHINPAQTITVDYSINMPKSVPPGGYYATVFTETSYPKSANGITLNERVGEIFYLQASGTVVKKGELQSWQSSFFQKRPVTADLRLKNDGAVHYPATIQIKVSDIFGHSKFTLNATKEILPQTIRNVPLSWTKAPFIGLFKVNGGVSFLNQHETLPTKWVLVMSPVARIVTILIALLIIVYIVTRSRLASKRSTRKTKPSRKK